MWSCKCVSHVSEVLTITYNQRYYKERYNLEHYTYIFNLRDTEAEICII